MHPALSQDRLGHAYLLVSPDADARLDAAVELAEAMLCTAQGKRPCGTCRNCRKVRARIHPDMIFLQRETDSKGKPRREIYVAQIRDLAADAAILPNEAERKVYIIQDAHTMNRSAQNAMLKLLEEPPRHVSFLLCAENAGAMLDTVRSRCVELSVPAREASRSAGADSLAAEYLALAAKGDAAALLRFCVANEGLDTTAMGEFLQAVQAVLSDRLCLRASGEGLSRQEMARLLGLSEQASRYLQSNVSVKHLLGLLSVRTIH